MGLFYISINSCHSAGAIFALRSLERLALMIRMYQIISLMFCCSYDLTPTRSNLGKNEQLFLFYQTKGALASIKFIIFCAFQI